MTFPNSIIFDGDTIEVVPINFADEADITVINLGPAVLYGPPGASGPIGPPGATGPVATGTMLLGSIGQNLTGGVYSTSYGYSTGNITVDFSWNPIQYTNNIGAFSITAPSHDGSCILTIFNQNGSGPVTFLGWTVGDNIGDSLDTISGHMFSIMMWGVQGVYTYSIKALQ